MNFAGPMNTLLSRIRRDGNSRGASDDHQHADDKKEKPLHLTRPPEAGDSSPPSLLTHHIYYKHTHTHSKVNALWQNLWIFYKINSFKWSVGLIAFSVPV